MRTRNQWVVTAAWIFGFAVVSILAATAGIVLLVKSPVWALMLIFPTLVVGSVLLFRHALVSSAKSVVTTTKTAVQSAGTRAKMRTEAVGLWKHKIKREFGLNTLAVREVDGEVKLAVQRRDDPRGNDLYDRPGKRRFDESGPVPGAFRKTMDEFGFAVHDEWWHPDYRHESFEILTLLDRNGVIELFRADGSPYPRPYSSLIPD